MRLGYSKKMDPVTAKHVCFNEAEAHAPRIQVEGPGRAGAGQLASMRPRRMRLGYWLFRRCRNDLEDVASMRPRRMRLGYRERWIAPNAALFALQ